MTYAELVALIGDYVENNEATFVANIDNFIKNAESRIYKDVRLKDGNTQTTGSLVTGTPTINAPAGVLYPRSFYITVSNVKIPLRYKDESFINAVWPNTTTTGTPAYYTMRNDGTIVIAPTPSSTFAYTFNHYSKGATIIGAAGNTSWLGDNAPMVLLYACLIEAYTFMKGSEDLINLYRTLYTEALTALKMESEVLASTDSDEAGSLRD